MHFCFNPFLSILFCSKQSICRQSKISAYNAASDIVRVLICEKLMNAEPDSRSEIDFGLHGFALAKRIDFIEGIILCGNQVALRMAHSDYFKAIPIVIETKQNAEKANDKEGLALALWFGDFGICIWQFLFAKSFLLLFPV